MSDDRTGEWGTSDEGERRRVIRGRDFRAGRAWGALDIAVIDGASIRLHWTDRPYRWHINDGEEVFVVLDGAVAMHVRVGGEEEEIVRLESGDVFHARPGCEHSAHPLGEARILVVERRGSV
jgi:mannose-6-phosphate isomerase-like protein (cupin superfamily)